MKSDLFKEVIYRLLKERQVLSEVKDIKELTTGASKNTWEVLSDSGQCFIVQRDENLNSFKNQADLYCLLIKNNILVPEVCFYGYDDELKAYIVTKKIEGYVLAPAILASESVDKEALTKDFARQAALIHGLDTNKVSFINYQDQVALLWEFYLYLNDPRPSFELAFRWLKKRSKKSEEKVLVHGDFRLGNFIVDDNGLKAVLDWEITHLGNRYEDLAWICLRPWRFKGPNPVAGLGSYETFFSQYSQMTGIEIDREEFLYWSVLGFLKWGIYCLYQYQRGAKKKHLELTAIGKRVGEQELDTLYLMYPDSFDFNKIRTFSASLKEEVSPCLEPPGVLESLDTLSFYLTNQDVDYMDKVAKNSLAIIARELKYEKQLVLQYQKQLKKLGFGDEKSFCLGLRHLADEDPIHAPIIETAITSAVYKVVISNPDLLINYPNLEFYGI
jgi:aminoglycoside phosphotransferase (APT) family kinase protein